MSLKNKILKNYKHKNKWAKRTKNLSWRLYEHDIPEYPFIVDIYDIFNREEGTSRYAVIWNRFKKIDHEKGIESKIEELKDALHDLEISDKFQIFKSRKIREDKEQYKKTNNTKKKFLTQDSDRLSLVNLYDYLDTGLFLDHRPLRDHLQKISTGKSVLNLFSYTCMISVACAKGGASRVDSVDLSQTYLQWGEENFEVNELMGDYNFINSDVLEFLENTNNLYELIILDPPTFSNSKKTETILDIQKDHSEYIDLCMRCLRDGGELIFSNNLRSFKLDQSIQEKYQVQEITGKTIPEDFRDKNIHSVYHITR
ncbi:MAG: hypothetical protein GY909_13175 [Oligoflexia bacterium]|nr:hypothetical protein [Oligoflexia bacterium]